MTKPNTLKDLLTDGHISLGDVRAIAREIFNGKNTSAGPSGYVVTAVSFDALPEHVQGFIIKATLDFGVENLLDVAVDTVSADDVVTEKNHSDDDEAVSGAATSKPKRKSRLGPVSD